MKKNILLAIRIISALVFIVSGLSKLFPAEVFELTLKNVGAASEATAPYLARFIIAIELFLGFALLQKNYLKRIIVSSSILLLTIFSVHLIYTLFVQGNSGNCGCFGELLPMSPLSALIKNIILIILLVYFYINYNETTAHKKLIPAIILLLSLFAVDTISPIQELQKDKVVVSDISDSTLEVNKDTSTQQTVTKDSISEKIIIKEVTPELLPKVKSMFSDFHYFSDSDYVDLDKGIKIAALLSLDCEHCMAAAKEINQLKKETRIPPVYFLYLGEEDQLQSFYAASGANKIPYKIINARTFFTLIKEAPPRIVLLNNGNITGDWGEKTFSKKTLKNALTK